MNQGAGSQKEYGIGGLTLASLASSSDPFKDGMQSSLI